MPGDLDETDAAATHHRQHVGLYVSPCVFILVSNLRGNHDDPIKWTWPRPRILLKATGEIVTRSCVTVMPSSIRAGTPFSLHCEHSNSPPTMLASGYRARFAATMSS